MMVASVAAQQQRLRGRTGWRSLRPFGGNRTCATGQLRLKSTGCAYSTLFAVPNRRREAWG
ncbi:uncharacterized protein BO72DRAFT_451382 [Aspergillus fijiensis CBS 313.89]|uniref:Uncharacterized protein n=1 Tax=Aspergillus fijiensis CBS 313.89 TaxID=1448319 RepID=A0A8G1VUV5_9EURO|nr:uncharacterized protein BO72DRAFT_451382 [Aspergillus fijiensis CBS 313.89]RAK73845.1 hypothetical protein BO72DRAFT_451382 [Aspergillus fijiensis CBS 313.89]